MSRVRITTSAEALRSVLAAAPRTVHGEVGLLTARFGALLQTRVRARASGRPGPRRQTGDYRRSITTETSQVAPGVWQAIVGTNSPQGRRLEYGFQGQVDALGRRFNQPPFPHFGPALDETVPEYEAAMGDLIERVLNGRRSAR